MFQYTTENIINDINEVRVHKTDALIVDGVGYFDKKYISDVYKNPYVAEAKEVIKLTPVLPKGITPGTTIRLKVEVALEGEMLPTFATMAGRFEKPYYYEVAYEEGDDAAKVVGKLVKVFKKDKLNTEKIGFDLTNAEAAMTFTGTTCYARFKSVEMATVPAAKVSGAVTGYEDYDVFAAWDKKTYTTRGTEGAGTTTRLIKNLRLPTAARTEAFAPDFGGHPIPGVGYDQFTITYVTERQNVGGQVMGAIDKSLTTHVLFIQTTDSSAFEGHLSTLDITPKTVTKSKTANPEKEEVATTKYVDEAVKAAAPAKVEAAAAPKK